MKTNYNIYLYFLILFVIIGLSTSCINKKIKTDSEKTVKSKLQQSFEYTAGGSVMVSGHRGSNDVMLPENSLETFRKITEAMPVFFEIDPRLTKDSVIVLMHDATLDRITNGTGKLSDYTWDELQSIRLKDGKGELTTDKIPLLKDVILWSKGKTVVNLDKKDVPMEMIVDLIRECDAEEYIMLTVHTGAQARYYYDRFPQIMLSAFMRTEKEYEDMAISGVPWENMIAYVGPTIDERNKAIVERLHGKGVKCMISVAPTHDKLPTRDERIKAYKEEMAKKPDIIESDYPLDVWEAIR